VIEGSSKRCGWSTGSGSRASSLARFGGRDMAGSREALEAIPSIEGESKDEREDELADLVDRAAERLEARRLPLSVAATSAAAESAEREEPLRVSGRATLSPEAGGWR